MRELNLDNITLGIIRNHGRYHTTCPFCGRIVTLDVTEDEETGDITEATGTCKCD